MTSGFLPWLKSNQKLRANLEYNLSLRPAERTIFLSAQQFCDASLCIYLADGNGKQIQFVRSADGPLKSGDGGGTFDGMETRISKLESNLIDIKVFLARIEENLESVASSADVKELKGKVDGLPTTLQLLGFVIAVLAVAGLAKHFAL
ncbi:hypothetical protein [Phyllobacterium sp. P30BS-XVII]|uniref:hypothetical protein n=1 Tax=Phyllobacterium sp. P30BS-XVII TaxID=2587046 RepID=UPI0015F90E4A|nr:hypothetical protein [Phyllobacterium sp. P30BS-XVII]MBA8900310.1 hypothetical protein [Phyllobacterium sp. P30BS-XVII]